MPGSDMQFIDAVRESYAQYNAHGARSSAKLRPLHQWVADEMIAELGPEYETQSLRQDARGKENTISGQYYDKKVDITIIKEEEALAIISVKFITSNYSQNVNNYFEHLMGETANLRRKGVIFGHFMVLPTRIPYFKKNGEIARIEVVKDQHLRKYQKLASDRDYPHKPHAIGIGLISLHIDDLSDVSRIQLADLSQMGLSRNMMSALNNELSITHFLSRMKSLVERKAAGY